MCRFCHTFRILYIGNTIILHPQALILYFNPSFYKVLRRKLNRLVEETIAEQGPHNIFRVGEFPSYVFVEV